jgi:hypothetical protein
VRDGDAGAVGEEPVQLGLDGSFGPLDLFVEGA